MIDGVDIKQYSVQDLRQNIGLVMQEPLLFNETIKYNILYGNQQASDEKVYEVALMANALGFIEQNEDISDVRVQQKVEKKFVKKIKEIKQDYPNFLQIDIEFQKKNIKHQELRVFLSVTDNVNA